MVKSCLSSCPPAVRETYRELERDYIAYMEGGTVEVPTAAILKNKLLQCCNGFVYASDNDDERITVPLHDEKVEALQTIAAEHSGRPLLVAYTYQPDRDRILAAFPNAELFDGRDDLVDRWNAGEIENAGRASGKRWARPQHAGTAATLSFGSVSIGRSNCSSNSTPACAAKGRTRRL